MVRMNRQETANSIVQQGCSIFYYIEFSQNLVLLQPVHSRAPSYFRQCFSSLICRLLKQLRYRSPVIIITDLFVIEVL